MQLESRVGLKSCLYNSDGSIVLGAKTADGTEHVAKQTILAAGAGSDLFLDFKKQLRPTAWTLVHLPLSAEEAESNRKLPVLYGVDRGFFIEPDIERHEMKFWDEHPGYINLVLDHGDTLSVPFARHRVPDEAKSCVRLLRDNATIRRVRLQLRTYMSGCRYCRSYLPHCQAS